VPQRKKFNLIFTEKSVSAVTASGDVEFGIEYDNIGWPLLPPREGGMILMFA
jgi:hypothetical protein